MPSQPELACQSLDLCLVDPRSEEARVDWPGIFARLLPFVMAANVAALHGRSPGHPALRRYEEVARILTGRPDATIADGIRWAHSLCVDLGIPALNRHGVVAADIPAIVADTQRASSTKGNPIALTDEELADVLHQAL